VADRLGEEAGILGEEEAGILGEEQAGPGKHVSAHPLIPWFQTQKTEPDEAPECLNPAGFSAPYLHAHSPQRSFAIGGRSEAQERLSSPLQANCTKVLSKVHTLLGPPPSHREASRSLLPPQEPVLASKHHVHSHCS